MSKFFWQHLEHDINILSCATGKSKDEACLLLHLVLRDVVIKNPVQCEEKSEVFALFNIMSIP